MKSWIGAAAAALTVLAATACSSAGTTTGSQTPAATPPAQSAAAATTPSAETPTTAAAPSPTSDWYASLGTFDPITKSGKSAAVITLPAGVTAGIITATYSGTSNFIVQGLDASNQPTIDGAVNVIGAYNGVTAFGVMALGSPTASFQVTATGAWTIKIAPLSSAAALPASGKGDGVFRYDGPAKTWAITHKGTANFIVQQYTADSAMPGFGINEIGAYDGSVPGLAGPSIIVIQADGAWTATAS